MILYIQICYMPTNYRYWPIIDDALRTAAIDRQVQVRMLISNWNHTRKAAHYFLQSLVDINGSYRGVVVQVVNTNCVIVWLVVWIIGVWDGSYLNRVWSAFLIWPSNVLLPSFHNMPLEHDQLLSIFPRKSLCEGCTLLKSQSGSSHHPNTPSSTGC
jgi:hypothetical protein